jgi:hypothetical protein
MREADRRGRARHGVDDGGSADRIQVRRGQDEVGKSGGVVGV